MPGTVLNASYLLPCKILTTRLNEMGIVFTPTLQMRTLGYREAESLSQGHSLVNHSLRSKPWHSPYPGGFNAYTPKKVINNGHGWQVTIGALWGRGTELSKSLEN